MIRLGTSIAIGSREIIRRSLFVIAVAGLLPAGGPAYATSMTQQQVRNTCGSKMTSGSLNGVSAMGCEKKCGDKICTYACTTRDGKETCEGNVVGRAAPVDTIATPDIKGLPAMDTGVRRPPVRGQ